MLNYDRIDISEGTDVNKASELKECYICHYWQFPKKGLNSKHMCAYAIDTMVY